MAISRKQNSPAIGWIQTPFQLAQLPDSDGSTTEKIKAQNDNLDQNWVLENTRD